MLTGVLTVPDYALVSQAVRASEDIAAGEPYLGVDKGSLPQDSLPSPPLSTN